MKRVIALLLALAVLILDQWSKYKVSTEIALGEVLNPDHPIMTLTYVRNTGAAWSILEGKMIFFYIISILACGVILYFLFKAKQQNWWFYIGLGLLLGGTLGNFIDRMRLGYVVDMMHLNFINFPIFNIADMALSVGLLGLIIDSFLESSKGSDT